MTIPPDISPYYHERLRERAALMDEGSGGKLTPAQADQAAIADIRRVQRMEEESRMRTQHAKSSPPSHR